MKTAPEVDAWFSTRKPPAEAALRRLREAILGGDPRMTEYLKYGSVNFGYKGDFAAFVQTAKRTPVSLMLNRGAHIPGHFPHVEGSGPTARHMRFADLAEVEARADEVGAVARAWCDMMDSGGEPR